MFKLKIFKGMNEFFYPLCKNGKEQLFLKMKTFSRENNFRCNEATKLKKQ